MELEAASSLQPAPTSTSAVILTALASTLKAAHKSTINHLAFHPFQNSIATCSDDTTIKIWDLQTNKVEYTLNGHTKAVYHLAFSPNATIIASASADLSIKLWDASSSPSQYACIRTLYGHDHTVSSCEFLNSDTLISCSRDNTIKIWDIATGYCAKSLHGHEDWVRCLAISQNSSLIASGSNDRTVKLWDETGDCQGELLGHTHVVECVAFMPVLSYPAIRQLLNLKDTTLEKGKFLASGGRDNLIKIWDTDTLQCVATLVSLPILTLKSGHDNWVRGIAFHPLGLYMISVGDDNTLRTWDLRNARCVRTLKSDGGFVACVGYSPGGSCAATGNAQIDIWK